MRAYGGNTFEKIVARILNEFLINDDIVVARARESALNKLILNQSNLRNLIDFTKIPVKRKCNQSQLQDYPDLDLFALIKPKSEDGVWRLLAIISCKVSFHARHTESTFWGLLIRITSDIPYVVVTEDRDIYKPKASELGVSCAKSTATRRLLESFADGIYLVKKYRDENDPALIQDIAYKRAYLQQNSNKVVFDDPTILNHTQYCHCVRPFDNLIQDLLRWRVEIPD